MLVCEHVSKLRSKSVRCVTTDCYIPTGPRTSCSATPFRSGWSIVLPHFSSVTPRTNMSEACPSQAPDYALRSNPNPNPNPKPNPNPITLTLTLTLTRPPTMRCASRRRLPARAEARSGVAWRGVKWSIQLQTGWDRLV